MKNILLLANGGKGWIGGLYYVKNILFTFLKNEKDSKDKKVYILVNKENADVFKKYGEYENIKIIISNDSSINKVVRKISSKLSNDIVDLEILALCKKYNIDTIYPVMGYSYKWLEDICVHWIADFQHIYLPHLFSKEELDKRNSIFKYIAENHRKLVLSSNDAFETYKKLYPDYTDNVLVIPFMSDIEEELELLNDEYIKKVANKYSLPNNFLFLPNQFWMHKNHITAFRAINYLVNEKNQDIFLVCTGNTDDYRNKDHFNELKKYIEDNNLENNIIILGFISRLEQLAIMQKASIVIQPSLFEGWGTSVEDAKVMKKDIILSDIQVHYEQMDKHCTIFKKEDYKDLANKILEVLRINNSNSI